MSTLLYTAPAGGGKTAYLIEEARRLARDLTVMPRVVVPTRLQIRAWRRQLAVRGGALGVRVGTFDDVYRDILDQAGNVVTRLSDPIQFRLLRSLLDEASLTHYASLRAAPGFVQVLRDLIREMKAGGIFPQELTAALKALGAGPRLLELAHLYTVYQKRLLEERWADYAGIGWLAAEALRRDPTLASEWSIVMVDGFDDLTTVQIRLLQHLSERVDDLTITMTGTARGGRGLVHKRFNRTRQRLEEALDVEAQPLPRAPSIAGSVTPLDHLERTMFTREDAQRPANGAVTLIAAPDRQAEVRTALRWLKQRIVRGSMAPGQVALLCRSSDPYRAFVVQIAEEFGMPIRIVGGRPLRTNPAVAALFNLLRLTLPGDGHLSWRATVEAWRSPYIDWSASALGITSDDAEALDRVARWGSIVGGLNQWQETFRLLTQTSGGSTARDEEVPETRTVLPNSEDIWPLWQLFQGFVERISPPDGRQPCRNFVAWLEALIGDAEPGENQAASGSDGSLGVARRALDGPQDLIERDMAALNALKDILRALVWADEAVGCAPQSFEAFFADLEGAVDAATYRVPLPSDEEALLVADVTQARGVSFRAVAILGLAEGAFPQTLKEDPFLRDDDRARLRDEFGLAIDLSTDGAETEYFYEAVTRPREALLLTRPRIADDGAPWQPSPFWEEVRRRLHVTPQRLTTQHRPPPQDAASWLEVVRALGSSPQDAAAWDWVADRRPALRAAIKRATAILRYRTRGAGESRAGSVSRYDGDLSSWGDTFEKAFGPSRMWSASRLEAYHICPFLFFIGRVLGLEPRVRPAEGLDARQLGNIYHRIFEQLYQTVGGRADLEALQENLPTVAREVLDAAPRREQFRATAWWEQTRRAIEEQVARSLETLESMRDDFTFHRAEETFGIAGKPGPPLIVRDEEDVFQLRGYIDRIDRSDDGRIRIIDYKTAGPSRYTDTALHQGEKLQLPLYALAAQEALQLGSVVDGFYWHVQQAAPSSFALASYGPQDAMEMAVTHAWDAVRGARSGAFAPRVPDKGCPSYCPAAAFCWHFEPRPW